MEMEEERIGLVLVRASEIHSKIASCIPKFTNKGVNGSSLAEKSSQVESNEEEEETLLSICDVFDSLESHLSSLQALQQQQQYEREAVIRDIEYNRKMLLKKLCEYKGEHLDVIREAEAFVSMKVESDSELLLPPYPAHVPNSLILENSHLSRISNARKSLQNGHEGRDESRRSQSNSNKFWGGLKFIAQTTSKTMLILVGVVTLLSLAGFEPKLKKKGTDFATVTLFPQCDSEEERIRARCPPGKVAVEENGEIHCIVKERVEIPFDSVAANPDVNYGCG